MANTNMINDDEFERVYFKNLNDAMTESAEPIIQKALADIERQMREKLAQALISIIKNDFNIQRNGRDLMIIVKQAENRIY